MAAKMGASGKNVGHHRTLPRRNCGCFSRSLTTSPPEKLAEVIMRELGQHVALHLECYHGHDLDAARARWAHEQKEAA